MYRLAAIVKRGEPKGQASSPLHEGVREKMHRLAAIVKRGEPKGQASSPLREEELGRKCID